MKKAVAVAAGILAAAGLLLGAGAGGPLPPATATAVAHCGVWGWGMITWRALLNVEIETRDSRTLGQTRPSGPALNEDNGTRSLYGFTFSGIAPHSGQRSGVARRS